MVYPTDVQRLILEARSADRRWVATVPAIREPQPLLRVLHSVRQRCVTLLVPSQAIVQTAPILIIGRQAPSPMVILHVRSLPAVL